MNISSAASFFLALAVASSRIVATGATVCDASHPDFVTYLPGYHEPLPSPWCSGFVTYEFQNRTIHTHYVLIMAEDDFDDDKPLIYFSNGGPGASSMYGLFTELGPLKLSDLSKETESYFLDNIPSPIYNHYNYARLGNLLIVDQPAPVGFSYCNNATKSHSCAGLTWTDQLTSENAFLALKGFYNTFPTYKDKDLYLVGESYAGVYIPNLAARILEHPAENIPLKGLAIGDGCLGIDTGICATMNSTTFTSGILFSTLFFAGHGQIPFETAFEIIKECKPHEETMKFQALETTACQAAMDLLKKQLGGFYAYNLYDDCTYQHSVPSLGTNRNPNDTPCGGNRVMTEYLQLEEVKKALHVERGQFFMVDNGAGIAYKPTEKDVRPFYKKNHGKFRVLIYDGDADPCVNSLHVRYWTSHMGFPEVESWRPWTLDGCRMMGGYVTRYEGNFDFLTIRGSGHMVPMYKPSSAYAFMKAWLNNETYPIYDKTCIAPEYLEAHVE